MPADVSPCLLGSCFPAFEAASIMWANLSAERWDQPAVDHRPATQANPCSMRLVFALRVNTKAGFPALVPGSNGPSTKGCGCWFPQVPSPLGLFTYRP